ncbi:MAG TPA: helix-turn-helix domain-containing protein [Pilimelia sp.]|nr:helix-turn-helix domain-containing protein [Pilimelia sp.]
MTDTPASRSESLADKINYLYAAVVPAGRSRPYTDREVAAAIKAAGTDISASYLNLLRTGERTNPTKRHLEALARFFGVPVGYFFDEDTATVEEELRRLQALRDLKEAFESPQVRTVALKARGLSEVSLQQLGAIIDHVRALERAGGRTPEEEPGG